VTTPQSRAALAAMLRELADGAEADPRAAAVLFEALGVGLATLAARLDSATPRRKPGPVPDTAKKLKVARLYRESRAMHAAGELSDADLSQVMEHILAHARVGEGAARNIASLHKAAADNMTDEARANVRAVARAFTKLRPG
jgi:hypothetical protein